MDNFQKLILLLSFLVDIFVMVTADSWTVFNNAVAARCSALCLNKFGHQAPPQEEMVNYNLYRPYRCEDRKCHLALLPCQWIWKSEEDCLKDCPSLECKDTCYLLQYIKSQTPKTNTIEDLERQFPSRQMLNDPEIICQQDKAWGNFYMYATIFIHWKLLASSDSSPPGPIIVLISTKKDSEQSRWHLLANTSEPVFSVKLSYDSKYDFHMTAFNHLGLIGTGTTGWIKPKPHKGELEPVKNLEISDQFLEDNSLSVRIRWTPPEAGSCFHKLKWLSESSGPILKNLMVCPEPEYTLRNLAFSEHYSVSLVSTNQRFDRDSNPVSITFVTKSCLTLTNFNYSKCGPEAPQNVNFRMLPVSENSSSILVTWQSPLHVSPDNKILGYYLTWKKVVPILEAPFEIPENGSIELDRHNLSCLLRDLRPGSNYFISVSAVSEGGIGKAAKIMASTNLTKILETSMSSKTTDYNSSYPDVWVITVPIGVLLLISIFIIIFVVLYQRKIKSYPKTKPSLNVQDMNSIESRGPLPQPVCSQDKFELNKDNLHLLDVIGEGAFGKVIKAAYAFTTPSGTFLKKTVAVKTLKENASMEDRKMLLLEIDAMKDIGRNRHVVNMVGFCHFDDYNPALVLEYCPLGDLKNYLRTSRPEGMNDSFEDAYKNVLNETNNCKPGSQELSQLTMLSFARQIAIGMEYLSKQKVVHRDLAARNILVASPNLVKISDFGLARDVYESNLYLPSTRQKLPYKWMALETLKDLIFTVKSDVWSFGVILWEITSLGSCPYPGCNGMELYYSLEQGLRLSRPQRCDENLYHLMLQCWNGDPNLRPDFTSLRHSIDQLMTKSNQYLELESIEEQQNFTPDNRIIITTTGDKSPETRNETPKLNRSYRTRTPDGYLIPKASHLDRAPNSNSSLPTQSPNHLTIPVLPRYIISPNSWSPSKKNYQDCNSACVPIKKKDDEEEAYDSGCGGEGGSSLSTSPAFRSSPLGGSDLEFSFEFPRSLTTANGTTDFSSNQYLQVSPPVKEIALKNKD